MKTNNFCRKTAVINSRTQPDTITAMGLIW